MHNKQRDVVEWHQQQSWLVRNLQWNALSKAATGYEEDLDEIQRKTEEEKEVTSSKLTDTTKNGRDLFTELNL